MANPKLTTELRKIFGRKVKNLRQQGLLPATVYGKELKSRSLIIEQKKFNPVYDQVGETGLIDLAVKGEKKIRTVLVHNLQSHPITNQPLHVEFHQVDLTKKVTLSAWQFSEQAKEKGMNFSVGTYPFQALGKSIASMETEGFAQVLADKKTGEWAGTLPPSGIRLNA